MTLKQIQSNYRKGSRMMMNKTVIYLAPRLTDNKEDLRVARSLSVAAMGIEDVNLDIKDGLFLLVNKNLSLINLDKAISHFKESGLYLYDYPYAVVTEGELHMLVLKFPDERALKYFKEGKYSMMYDERDIVRYFEPKENEALGLIARKVKACSVFRKDDKYRETFQDYLNSFGGYEASPIIIYPECELDFSFKKEEEIFE